MLAKIVSPNLPNTNKINTDHATSLEGQPAVIAKPVEGDIYAYWVIDAIQISYREVLPVLAGEEDIVRPRVMEPIKPLEGGLIITDGSKVILDIDINIGFMSFQLYLPISPENGFSITLRPGNTDYIGKLNVQSHLEMSA